MVWTSSSRKLELPENWEEIRSQVLRRDDYFCQMNSEGCLGAATEVDHKIRGNDHSLKNLRAVCTRCHASKSSAEGHARRRELRSRRFRPTQRHPGMT